MTVEELQEEQNRYDDKYWEMNEPPRAKLQHITWHLVITLGKLARLNEQLEHGRGEIELDGVLTSEIIPDLQMHSLQLSNLCGRSLEALYRDRLSRNIVRFEGRA